MMVASSIRTQMLEKKAEGRAVYVYLLKRTNAFFHYFNAMILFAHVNSLKS